MCSVRNNCTHTITHVPHTPPQPITSNHANFAPQEQEMCQTHFITGFPSIRVFRRGHDDIYIQVRTSRRVDQTENFTPPPPTPSPPPPETLILKH
jgi:hypothetical protein